MWGIFNKHCLLAFFSLLMLYYIKIMFWHFEVLFRYLLKNKIINLEIFLGRVYAKLNSTDAGVSSTLGSDSFVIVQANLNDCKL